MQHRKSRRPGFCQVETLERRELLSASHQFVTQTNLVSNQAGVAPVQDMNLVNPWGIAFAAGQEFWIADNNSGLSSQYDGTGAAQFPPTVLIPGAGGAPANPTGQVFAGGQGFPISENGVSGHAQFIFVGEDGGISAWDPTVDPTHAVLVMDNSLATTNPSAGAVYKGATLASVNGAAELFVTNFRSGKVEAYDNNFHPVTSSSSAFSDKRIPKGYAPFNIQNVNGNLYVTYAKQNSLKHDDVAGNGHGFVDVFDSSGNLLRRLAHGSFLNAPWGIAVAPPNWGKFAGDILVGQFGDGRIDVFNPKHGQFISMLRDAKNKPITIDGLWTLTPGTGSATASVDTIFFTAGPDGETNGLFGTLNFTVIAGKSSSPSSPTPTSY